MSVPVVDEESSERVAWWRARRAHYNRGLVIAGLAAFMLYALVVSWRIAPVNPEAEITLFTTALQGLGYLLAMGVANICYGLGPWLERRVRPTDAEQFRKRTYSLGYAFSVALPFCIPVLLLLLPVSPGEPL